MTLSLSASDTQNPAETALGSLIEQFHSGQFHSGGRLRVWSLIITVFGDAIVPRGGRVGMAALQDLTDRLGVAPGALRAAMSRLAKDGWVVRHRDGRKSYYSLAPDSAATFADAGRRFYASGPPGWDGDLTVAVTPERDARDDDVLCGNGFVPLAAGIYLRPGPAPVSGSTGTLSDALLLQTVDGRIPGWVRAQLSSPDVAAAYRQVIASFAPLDAALEGGAALSPLDAFAARTLLVHDWRRIVLRDRDLPLNLRPDDWPGEAARSLVKGLYARLLSPSERFLNRCEAATGVRLAAADASLEARFAEGDG